MRPYWSTVISGIRPFSPSPYVPGAIPVVLSSSSSSVPTVRLLFRAVRICVPAEVAMFGFGYVPASAPPAGPEGGSVVGITPGAMSLAVIDPSRILAEFTELSASFAVVTAPFAILAVVMASVLIVGFGYVPVRSPPAGPVGVDGPSVAVPTFVRRPYWSTVTIGISVRLP